MKRILLALVAFLLLLTGCSAPDAMSIFATQTFTPTITPTITPTVTLTFIPTSTPTLTPTITLTLTPTPTITPVWVVQGPGSIICPILLYHHIKVPEVANALFVTPNDFRAQMQFLHDNGYTPVPVSLLIKAIEFGAPLPEHPVVILSLIHI